MVQAFEVAAAHNLQAHRLHQSTLGKEHVGTVEQFLRMAGHEHVVSALPIAEERVGSSGLLYTGQVLYLAGQRIDGVAMEGRHVDVGHLVKLIAHVRMEHEAVLPIDGGEHT